MEVDGVRSLIDGSIADVDEAVALIRAAKQAVDNAYAKIMIVRATSVDPVGLPWLRHMTEDLDRTVTDSEQFKSDVQDYRRML